MKVVKVIALIALVFVANACKDITALADFLNDFRHFIHGITIVVLPVPRDSTDSKTLTLALQSDSVKSIALTQVDTAYNLLCVPVGQEVKVVFVHSRNGVLTSLDSLTGFDPKYASQCLFGKQAWSNGYLREGTLIGLDSLSITAISGKDTIRTSTVSTVW